MVVYLQKYKEMYWEYWRRHWQIIDQSWAMDTGVTQDEVLIETCFGGSIGQCLPAFYDVQYSVVLSVIKLCRFKLPPDPTEGSLLNAFLFFKEKKSKKHVYFCYELYLNCATLQLWFATNVNLNCSSCNALRYGLSACFFLWYEYSIFFFVSQNAIFFKAYRCLPLLS